jgi:hypothetical protein
MSLLLMDKILPQSCDAHSVFVSAAAEVHLSTRIGHPSIRLVRFQEYGHSSYCKSRYKRFSPYRPEPDHIASLCSKLPIFRLTSFALIRKSGVCHTNSLSADEMTNRMLSCSTHLLELATPVLQTTPPFRRLMDTNIDNPKNADIQGNTDLCPCPDRRFSLMLMTSAADQHQFGF